MFDKEVLLAIINGPGTGLTLMVLGIIAAMVITSVVRMSMRHDKAFEKGKEAARYDQLERINTTLSKLSYDQQQMRDQIGRG